MRLVTCLVGDKYTEEMNDALNPDWTYRGEFCKLSGVWNKLAMLLVPGPNFYVDLDSVIRGKIPKVHTDKLGIGRDYYKDDVDLNEFSLDTKLNSSIMYWVEPQIEIFDRFWNNKDYFMRKYRGIDRFLWWECKDLWEVLPDGIFSSHANPYPEHTPILTYNGEDFGPYFKSNQGCL